MSNATLDTAAPSPLSASASSLGTVAPLGRVLAVTWIGSVATGIPYNGLFFITKHVFNFTPIANFALGVMLGITYIIGSLGTGPLLRRLRDRGLIRNARHALVVLTITMALLCWLPVIAFFFTPPDSRASASWSVWAFMAFYSALCGGFWPIVEAFLSGGRTAAELRSTTGKFNMTWSSALVFSLWSMVSFDEKGQVLALLISSGMHLLSLVWIVRLPAEPGAHAHQDHPAPSEYRVLLAVHRVLMPASYLVMYALSPQLPAIMSALNINPRWEPAIASSWLIARVLTFTTLERWHGWHGRWTTPAMGLTFVLAGFCIAVLSPVLATGTPGTIMLIMGLLIFGAGAATIYAAALYYAMEVGSAEVEAGGMHEAMIGVGYTLGPVCGLIPAALASAGAIAQSTANPLMLGLVGASVAGSVGLAWRVKSRTQQRLETFRNPN